MAKCAVISLERLERETSRARGDHFCIGRLFQPVAVAYAADQATRERLLGVAESAVRLSYDWVRPWLPPDFDAETYYRTLLRVSLSRELRPEPSTRVDSLWAAQREHAREVATPLLEELAAAGELEPRGEGRFGLTSGVGSWERGRRRLYFWRSIARATVRWFKHVVTFEGWLDYLLHKVERHTDEQIVLSERERRWPLIFLWPRVIRHLRHKDS
jgi:hypothetical protein